VSLERRQDLALVELRRHSREPSWWIGYLDTGASEIVFWDAPKVTLYGGWHYVMIRAGPDQGRDMAARARWTGQLEEHRTARVDVPPGPFLAGVIPLG
jgi:hypothetical protein